MLDATPTALHVLGIPAGLDMDGKVLVNAFEDGRAVEKIESWDAVEGEDGRHSADEHYDSAAAAESLKQLVDLGYVAPPGKEGRDAVKECLAEQRYNLARAHADGGRPDLAAPLVRELIAGDPEDGRYYFTLAAGLMQAGDGEGCRQLLDGFDKACAEFAPRAAGELKRRRDEKPDKEVGGREEPGGRREMFERRQLAEKAGGWVMDRLFLRCRLALGQPRSTRRKEQARALLEDLAKARRQSPGLRLFLAQGFAVLKEFDRAMEQLERVRRADPDNWEALGLEARIHFQARRYEQAVDRAVESLSLIYFQPPLHHLLGLALQRLGEKEKAEQAYRAALAQAPEFPAVLEALGRLISRDRARIGEGSLLMARAAEFRRQGEQRQAERATPPAEIPPPDSAKPAGLPAFDRSDIAPPADRSLVVTVVAGLPRSGTSMAMQMLAAAGLPAYADEHRPPDADNPRGYFEHEQATKLHRDASWVPQARGKAVKIVAHLLAFLPKGEQYRLIFMHRDMREVLASQKAMLERLGRKGGELAEARLMRVYTQQLVRVQTWLRRRAEIPVLAVNYAEALADPAATAAKLARFLGQPFDAPAAAAAIEPSLRRQGGAAPPSAPPAPGGGFAAALIWMAAEPLRPETAYLLEHTTRQVRANVRSVRQVADRGTPDPGPAAQLKLNDMAEVEIETHQPIFFDPYRRIRATGSFILIDMISNGTVAAGMILGPQDSVTDTSVHAAQETRLGTRVSGTGPHRGLTVWFTGLSASGKTTLCEAVYERLSARGCRLEVLDGDTVRKHLSKGLGFSREDRDENIRRIGFVAGLLTRHGVIALAAAISPYRAVRDEVRASIGDFVEVYVNTPLEVCEARDPKGLYRKARAGQLPMFTGIDDPYEPPLRPEVECRTDRESLEECVAKLLAAVDRALER